MKTAITKIAGVFNGRKLTSKNVKLQDNNLLRDDLEELEQHIASALAWSDKHNKEEILSAILNHTRKIIDKHFGRKYIELKI